MSLYTFLVYIVSIIILTELIQQSKVHYTAVYININVNIVLPDSETSEGFSIKMQKHVIRNADSWRRIRLLFTRYPEKLHQKS
jgi:hypothetical protein